MDAADLARMTPQDGIVTLRSLPRRFRAALRPVADDDLDEFVERIGAAGRSPMDHLVDAGRSLTLLQHAFEQVQHHDRPVVPPAAIDPSAMSRSVRRHIFPILVERSPLPNPPSSAPPRPDGR